MAGSGARRYGAFSTARSWSNLKASVFRAEFGSSPRPAVQHPAAWAGEKLLSRNCEPRGIETLLPRRDREERTRKRIGTQLFAQAAAFALDLDRRARRFGLSPVGGCQAPQPSWLRDRRANSWRLVSLLTSASSASAASGSFSRVLILRRMAAWEPEPFSANREAFQVESRLAAGQIRIVRQAEPQALAVAAIRLQT